MKICLLLYLVTACSSGRVSFQQQEQKDKETIIDDDDHSVQVSQYSQSIYPTVTDRPLDILMVIDNSGSMKEAHENLSTNLKSLLENVKDSDWRIVITTATFTDCLRAVINKGDNGYQQIFLNTIKKLKNENIDSEEERDLSNYEDTVRMATRALPSKKNDDSLQYSLPLRSLGYQVNREAYENRYVEGSSFFDTRSTWCTGDVNNKNSGGNSPRAQWLRDGSMLAILLITDEDAFSGDSSPVSQDPADQIGLSCGCKDSNVERSCKCIDDLWNKIVALPRTPRDTAKIYGLLNDTYSNFYRNWQSKEGKELFDMTAWVSTTGREGNKPTDESNFTEILKEISTDVGKQMGKTYTLERVHDGQTSKVIFVYNNNTEKEQPITDYRIDGQTLIFTKNQPDPDNVKMIKVDFSYSK